ncbi:MAG: ABC transporter substrate-binding protein [Eubacteriales bacterium]|nr:ABC transporter substrate-binding protein [Eubacteriales bacterium]
MKKALCLLVAALILCGCAACGGNSGDNSVLRLGATDDWTGQGLNLVFDHLTWREDRNGASDWVVSTSHNDDFTEWTLKVTDGIKFTDGTPVDAEVVKYSLESQYPTNTWGWINVLDSIEVTDPMTVTMKLKDTYTNIPNDLSYVYVVKPGSVSAEGVITEYIGSGCFILEDFQSGVGATFKLNKDYWNKDKKPSIETVEWKVYADETARVMALENKEVDALGVSEHANALSYATIKELSGVDGIHIDTKPEGNPNMYMYNYTNGPMTDFALRKAVTYAINRQKLADSVCYGYGFAMETYMAPDQLYAARNGESFGYDPELSKQTLAEAGYVDSDGDGFLEKDGEKITLRILTLSNETYRTVAVLVQSDLKAIGIDSTIEALEASGYFEKSPVGEFDICFTHPWTSAVAYFSWRGTYSDYDTMGTGWGFDPAFKGYLDEILTSTDQDEIWSIYDKIWKASYEFIPATPLYSGSAVYIYTDDVSGFIWTKGTQNLIDLSEVVIKRK